jgi:4-hydroxy-tetrahydrodipicolinate reductase
MSAEMKVALLGYGKMGKEIEKVLLDRNHTIFTIIDKEEDWEQNEQLLHCDVAIDFSTPQSAPLNLLRCFEKGIPVVCGTTGWLDRYDEIQTACTRLNGALFFASNFSIGVNIFFEINRRLAFLMNSHEDYDVLLREIHHIQKLDSPSGTAVTLARDLLEAVDRKKSWVNSVSENSHDLQILSQREGLVTGIHEVEWKSSIDMLMIRHEAFNRRGFAMGAVLAAEFIPGKSGIFGMKQLLNL